MFKKQWHIGVLLLVGVLLEIWDIGKVPIEQWDEARRGINAIEMLETGDFFTYHFLGEIDTFNTKPPLSTWLVAFNFKFFGHSLWSLRLHSVLATCLFLWFSVKLVRLFKSTEFTFLTLGIIITVKGIIGYHVGRSGDADSLLVLFFTMSIYYFLKYYHFEDTKSIFLSALTLGLAFYAKGLAIAIFLPGVVLYLASDFHRKKAFTINFGLAILLFLGVICSWAVLAQYGNYGDSAPFANLWEALYKVDGWTRFADDSFEKGYNPFFIFNVLDSGFNVWNYVLYLALAVAIVQIGQGKASILPNDKLLRLSICIILSMMILLTASMNKHRWYIAPGILFLAIAVAQFIENQIRQRAYLRYVFLAVLVLLIGKRFYELNTFDNSVPAFFAKHENLMDDADTLLVTRGARQDYVLHFILQHPEKALLVDDLQNVEPESLVLTNWVIEQEAIDCVKGYCLIKMD